MKTRLSAPKVVSGVSEAPDQDAVTERETFVHLVRQRWFNDRSPASPGSAMGCVVFESGSCPLVGMADVVA
jgi:hypothetical protein